MAWEPTMQPLNPLRLVLVLETPRPGTLRTTLAILPQVKKVSDRLVLLPRSSHSPRLRSSGRVQVGTSIELA